MAGPAAAEPASPGAARALDFMIENVCLDDKGHVLIGVSPIDGDPRCVTQRDLLPGERIAYHERDWPAQGSVRALRPRGADSFPVKTRAMGTVAIHIFDTQNEGPDSAFGQYDPAVQEGGGGIAALSDDTVSFVATQLGRQKLRLFLGKGCAPGQPVTPAALLDAWVLAPLDQLGKLEIPRRVADTPDSIAGGVISKPGGMVVAENDAHCPARTSYGTTRWSIRPVTYRAVYKSGPKSGTHVRLWTLVAERFGRAAEGLDNIVALERAYFTRELGWTRWEAWKSTKATFRGTEKWAADVSRGGMNQRVAQAHDRVAARGNCPLPDGTPADAPQNMPLAPVDSHGAPMAGMVIVGCIDVTNIVPPLNKDGDPPPVGPGSWYYATVNDANSPGAAIFGP